MEVKLNIEASQLGETVVDLFKNLLPEKKEELALTVLREWFNEPVKLETLGYIDILLAEYRGDQKKMSSIRGYGDYSSITDERIKDSYEFKRDLEKYKNTKQYMVDDLRTELLGYFKNGILEEMKKDPQIKEIQDIVYQEIKDRLPEIIMNVMMLNITNNMVEVQHKVHADLMKNFNFSSFKNSVMKKLKTDE